MFEEAGVPTQWKKCTLYSVKLLSNTTVSYTLADTYLNIDATVLKYAFYMLPLDLIPPTALCPWGRLSY